MSAKITVVVYILISFEIGILLMIIPWKPSYWDDNFFLYFITGKLHAAWMVTFLKHKLVRGAVSGLGVLNILAGIYDIVKFRESARKLAVLGEQPVEVAVKEPAEKEPVQLEQHLTEKEAAKVESAVSAAAAVSDHQPPSVPPKA